VNCGPRVAAAVPGDVHDMEHRAATRAGLALSLHAWGCRVSPANWDWSHLRVQLETALKHPHVRYLGDAWMLAVLVMLDATTLVTYQADISSIYLSIPDMLCIRLI
jgi:hypothetical protein